VENSISAGASRVVTDGERLYVAFSNRGLSVFELSVGLPNKLGHYELLDAIGPIVAQGTRAYIFTQDRLERLDVSRPDNIRKTHQTLLGATPMDAVLQQNMLYVSTGGSGLMIFEVD